MSGRFHGRLLIQHLNTPVSTRRTENKLAGNVTIRRHQRSGKATLACTRQRHRMFAIVIRHDSGDRTEGFEFMYGGCFIRLLA
ncbi:hypothetical protein D3C75_665060 [compost metagenome]